MELRPFRCLRHAPRVVFERGLSTLIPVPERSAAGGGAAPESLSPLLGAGGGGADPSDAARKISEWIAAGLLLRERRPALWIYRRTPAGDEAPPDAPLLVGLVRLGGPGAVAEPSAADADAAAVERQIAFLRATRTDFEPALLTTRAPLTGALSTTRRTDLSAADSSGARHDVWRVHDYAQHVELQGLVKNAEVELTRGAALWVAARAFDRDPDAAKLPGARFKLCAIREEPEPHEAAIEAMPGVPAGLFGVSLEDPVY